MIGSFGEIAQQLPDIPRLFTGIAEWFAVLTYVLAVGRRRATPSLVWRLAAALPALIALQLAIGSLPLQLWTLGMASAAFAMFGVVHLCTHLSIRDSTYLATRAFILSEFVQSLHWQLWVHWNPIDEALVERAASPEHLRELVDAHYLQPWTSGYLLALGSAVLVYALAFGLAHVAEKRNFSQTNWTGTDTYTIAVSIAIAVLAFTFSNLSFVFPGGLFTGTSGADVFYIRTLVCLIGVVALYVQQSRRNHSRAANELSLTQFIMQSQHAQYLQSKRNIEDLNRIHHDLKHYVHAIREEESAERREEYLNELESTLRGYESEIRTGHAPIDIILSTQMSRCLAEGISMTTMVDGAALEFLDLMSLSAIFGNTLDNAIEASRRVPDKEQRIIKVSAFNRHEFVVIVIENYWPFSVDFVDGLPQTTKKDRVHHGFGSRSIRRIAESYSGNVTFATENDWFTVRILIPRPAAS